MDFIPAPTAPKRQRALPEIPSSCSHCGSCYRSCSGWCGIDGGRAGAPGAVAGGGAGAGTPGSGGAPAAVASRSPLARSGMLAKFSSHRRPPSGPTDGRTDALVLPVPLLNPLIDQLPVSAQPTQSQGFRFHQPPRGLVRVPQAPGPTHAGAEDRGQSSQLCGPDGPRHDLKRQRNPPACTEDARDGPPPISTRLKQCPRFRICTCRAWQEYNQGEWSLSLDRMQCHDAQA